jgi:hypothetical protein
MRSFGFLIVLLTLTVTVSGGSLEKKLLERLRAALNPDNSEAVAILDSFGDVESPTPSELEKNETASSTEGEKLEDNSPVAAVVEIEATPEAPSKPTEVTATSFVSNATNLYLCKFL